MAANLLAEPAQHPTVSDMDLNTLPQGPWRLFRVGEGRMHLCGVKTVEEAVVAWETWGEATDLCDSIDFCPVRPAHM